MVSEFMLRVFLPEKSFFLDLLISSGMHGIKQFFVDRFRLTHNDSEDHVFRVVEQGVRMSRPRRKSDAVAGSQVINSTIHPDLRMTLKNEDKLFLFFVRVRP